MSYLTLSSKGGGGGGSDAEEGATGSRFLTRLRSDYMVIFKGYASYQAPSRRLWLAG